MTPANATDVEQFSPQHKTGISYGPVVNLRTPSSFISKNQIQSPFSSTTEPPPLPISQPSNFPINSLSLNLQSIGSSNEQVPLSQTSNIFNNSIPSNLECVRTQVLESSFENPPQGRYHRALINIASDSTFTKSEQIDNFNNPQKSQIFSPLSKRRDSGTNTRAHLEATGKIDSYVIKSDELCQDLAERMLSEALLPPSAIHANDIIGSTLGEKGLMYIREKLNSMNSNKEDIEQQGPFKARELDVCQKMENPDKEIKKLSNSRHEFSTFKSDFLAQTRNPQISGFPSQGKLSGKFIIKPR